MPDLPTDVTTEAVLDLYARFLAARRAGGASSIRIAQILDDWFTENGFQTVLYRSEGERR